MLQVVQRAWEGVRPPVKIFLAVGRNRAELRLLPTSRDDELVVIKERRAALALLAALLAVSKKLIDSFRDRFLDLWRLAFNDDYRQAIQEENDIGDDVIFSPEDTHLELAYGNETVAVPALKIDEMYGRAFFTGLTVLADAGVF
jgi:hypothetical protein